MRLAVISAYLRSSENQRQNLRDQTSPGLLVISFANVPAYHLSLNFGEKTVSSGLAGLLVSLGPVFITIFSAYALKEKVTSRVILALALALIGAAVLSVGDLSMGSGGIFGPLEIIVTAIAYAIFTVLAKPLVKKYGALHVAIWAGVTGTAMLLPLISGSFLPRWNLFPRWDGFCALPLPHQYGVGISNVLHTGQPRRLVQTFDSAVPDSHSQRGGRNFAPRGNRYDLHDNRGSDNALRDRAHYSL